MIDDHAFRTPCSFGSGMFMFASSYHGAQVLMSTLCISAIDDWHYGTRERTHNRWPWPSPRPGYYTRVWQPGIIIKCESANKLSSRPGRKCKIIDLTGAGAHINYVRSEVHNNKRGTLERPVSHTSAMWVTREILYAKRFSFLTLAGDATRSQLHLSHSQGIYCGL